MMRFWLMWLGIAILTLGVVHAPLWQAYAHFLNDPLAWGGDARQQIIAYLMPHPEQDYISHYYRQVFITPGIEWLYSTASHFTDIDSFARYTGLALFLLTVGFSGAAAWRLAGPWAAMAAMMYMVSAGGVLDRSLHGVPRGFSLPLIASVFWAASGNRWSTMAFITVLSVLFYPITTVISGLWMVICLSLRPGGEWQWRPAISRRYFLLLVVTAVCVGLLFAATSHWSNGEYGAVITPSMLRDYPEAGVDGRYSSDDSIATQSPLTAIQHRTYQALIGEGQALSLFTNIGSWWTRGSCWSLVVLVFAATGLGLFYLWRSGARSASFLAVSALVAIGIGYGVSYPIRPYAFLPDRYIVYSFFVLLPVFFACAMEGFARQLSQKIGMQRFSHALVLALPVLLFGTHDIRQHHNVDYPQGDVHVLGIPKGLQAALKQLPEDAVIAGWPDETLDDVAFFARRSVWLHYKTHQAFHTAYTLEMRRRMMLLMEALFGNSPAPLQKLQQEGVTCLLLEKPFYYATHPPRYFAPFDHYLRVHWEVWEQNPSAAFTLPASSTLYEDETWRLVKLPADTQNP